MVNFLQNIKMVDYWRYVPIQEYADRYLVSRNGEIWSIRSQQFLKPYLSNGYSAVNLHNGKTKNCTIKVLVATAFIPCNDPTLIVNHKNGIKTDDRVENLEWITYQGNTIHAIENGLITHHTVRVSQYTLDAIKIATYNSIKEAAIATRCSAKHISTVCRGKRRTTGGFIWRYEDEEDMPVAFDGVGIQHPEFPNYYIKSDGRIYSMATTRYLKPKINGDGVHLVVCVITGIKIDFCSHTCCYILFTTCSR